MYYFLKWNICEHFVPCESYSSNWKGESGCMQATTLGGKKQVGALTSSNRSFLFTSGGSLIRGMKLGKERERDIYMQNYTLLPVGEPEK